MVDCESDVMSTLRFTHGCEKEELMKNCLRFAPILLTGCIMSVHGSLAAIANVSGSDWLQPVPRWTEAEAKSKLLRQLPSKADSVHSYDVLFYKLDLDFPVYNDSLRGAALIRCRSEVDGLDSLYLHLERLTVDSVVVNGGAPASWNHVGGKIFIHFLSAFSTNDTFELLIWYGGTPYYGYYATGSGALRTAFTVTEPSDSRYWFPCWDEPWDKAEQGCEIHGEVPLGFVVASNGLLTRVDTTFYATDTTVTYRWVESYSIATYLMSVAIARYAELTDHYVTPTGDSIEVTHFVYREDTSSAAQNFVEVPFMMDFFSSIFGDYPFEKYGMACVADFGGGMEHQTMTTISRFAATSGWEDGVAHELAHQWWGDMVTCFDWPEIWINEGFATYSEVLWHEHKYGPSTFRWKMRDYGDDYLNGPYTGHSLYDPPYLFSWSLVYTKGAWVLHMLRGIVGDDSFFDILKAFGEKYRYGNATTEDLRWVVDSVMNDTFDYFFEEWVYRPGHPQYEYGYRVDSVADGEYLLRMQVRQGQEYGHLFRMPVDLQLTYIGGDTTVSIWASADTFQEATIPLHLPSGIPSFGMRFDPDNWVLEEHTEVGYVSVDEGGTWQTEKALALHQNVPNPFSRDTEIEFVVPATEEDGKIRVSAYNSLGQLVRILIDETLTAGLHTVTWDGRDEGGSAVRSGVYFCQLETSSGRMATRKMLVLR